MIRVFFIVMILGILGCMVGAIIDCITLIRISYIIGFISLLCIFIAPDKNENKDEQQTSNSSKA